MDLRVSSKDITFEPLQKVKQLQLTNQTIIQNTNRPIMFKIKTNKIDCVDAKPSCGYISGQQGKNQISISIRSLNNSKQYTAKLQILYIAHNRITEQMVEKNKCHFDITQYNQNYEAIKNQSHNDVRPIVINITKKVQQVLPPPPNPANPPVQPQQNPVQKEQKKGNSFTKVFFFIIASFLFGLIFGLKLGDSGYTLNSLSNILMESKPNQQIKNNEMQSENKNSEQNQAYQDQRVAQQNEEQKSQDTNQETIQKIELQGQEKQEQRKEEVENDQEGNNGEDERVSIDDKTQDIVDGRQEQKGQDYKEQTL